VTPLRALLPALLAACCGIAHAQSVAPDGALQVRESALERPSRGMTKAAVEQRFGTPLSRSAAVGQPPISRWDYDGFVVYFEHDRVIHAVVAGRFPTLEA
jgi:hypothetical protein